MGPDYSKAKNIEEARAIKNAFWDQIHKEVAEGKWRKITWEEFDRQVEEIHAQNRKLKEEQQDRDDDVNPAA